MNELKVKEIQFGTDHDFVLHVLIYFKDGGIMAQEWNNAQEMLYDVAHYGDDIYMIEDAQKGHILYFSEQRAFIKA